MGNRVGEKIFGRVRAVRCFFFLYAVYDVGGMLGKCVIIGGWQRTRAVFFLLPLSSPFPLFLGYGGVVWMTMGLRDSCLLLFLLLFLPDLVFKYLSFTYGQV